MEKYDLVVLLTYHENKSCLEDTIHNILKFNKNVCIIVSNGTDEQFTLTEEHSHIVKRNINFVKFDTMIPLHLELYEYMLKKDIVCNYVLLMSSNQLFVNHGFYDFIKKYDASYYAREIDLGCIPPLKSYEVFNNYYNDLGVENFKHQSNHDGMFFRYEIFCQMMDYFKGYKEHNHTFHGEEFLYVAYLLKNKFKLVEFSEYNYWQPNWRHNSTPINEQEVKECISKGLFLVKRVSREITDPTRIFIKGLN